MFAAIITNKNEHCQLNVHEILFYINKLAILLLLFFNANVFVGLIWDI
jgi:hypothetical protein